MSRIGTLSSNAKASQQFIKRKQENKIMELKAKTKRVRGVVDRYKEQYAGYKGDQMLGSGRTVAETIQGLQALGEHPLAEDVDAFMGNSSWTDIRDCSECRAESHKVVQLGEEPDRESSTAWVCEDCLEKALKLIRGE